jgi:thioredoxin 1
MNLPETPNSGQLVLLSFGADWCEPCQWVKPVLDEVMRNLGKKISLCEIDIDERPETAREHHVLSVPTLLLMKNGTEVWRMKGFDMAPNLIRIFETYL